MANEHAMTKQLLTAALLLLSAYPVEAQSLPEGRTEDTYVMTDRGIAGVLRLDTAQRNELTTIERRYEMAMDRLMENDTLEDQEAQRRADGLARERHEAIRAILTPEQYEHWARMLADADMQQ